MPKDIYEGMGKADEIVGGPGRLAYAFLGQTLPTQISDIVDRATMQLKPGWKDFGFTTDGIAISRSAEVEEIEVDQSYTAVDSRVTSTENTISTQLMQNTIENRQIANMGAVIIETPATFGTATTTTAAAAAGDKIIAVTSASGITAGSFIDVGGRSYLVNAVSGLNVILAQPLVAAAASAASVKPVTALKTKKISYGSMNDRPALMIALITQRANGTLLVTLFYNVKVSGDDVEQTFNKETRTLPLALKAYPHPALDTDSDIYTEIDEVLF